MGGMRRAGVKKVKTADVTMQLKPMCVAYYKEVRFSYVAGIFPFLTSLYGCL